MIYSSCWVRFQWLFCLLALSHRILYISTSIHDSFAVLGIHARMHDRNQSRTISIPCPLIDSGREHAVAYCKLAGATRVLLPAQRYDERPVISYEAGTRLDTHKCVNLNAGQRRLADISLERPDALICVP
jgi:hypothetical protein